jgi:hypothetical protein
MEEFVGAIICIISPRATSTDDDEGEGDEGGDGFSDFGEFSDIIFITEIFIND